MIQGIIILALIILVIVLRKRISDAVLGIILLAGLVFFAIYLLDDHSYVPIREYVNLEKYDDIKEDPTGELTEYGETIVDGGKDAYDVLMERGKALDEKHGTELGKEDGEDTTKDKGEKKKNSVEEENEEEEEYEEAPQLTGGSYYYDDMEKALDTDLRDMTSKEKGIVRSLTPFLSVQHETDNYIIESIKGVPYFTVTPK